MRVLTALIAGALVTPLLAGTAHAAQQWRPCPDNLPLECTTLSVPLDYRDSGGAKIEIAVSRLKATSKTRRGVLLLNPGGPGAAGIDRPVFVKQHAPQSLIDSYDLIGFDPRGTGHSSPLSCGLTADQRDPVKVWPQPAPNGDIAESIAYARQVTQQCLAKEGNRLPHITTANTARDMDRIRIALGEPKISYFGVSYGSYLGAVYTTLFPDRSDRFVLDSVVDPARVWHDMFRTWGQATEQRFEDFANWAAARDAAFELGQTPQAVRESYYAAARKLDAKPIGHYTGNMFRGEARWLLYFDTSFTPFAKLIQSIKLGTYVPRPMEGFEESFAVTLWSVACGDAEWPRDVTQYQRDVLVDRKRYPVTNGLSGNTWPCAFWPKPVEPTVRIAGRGQGHVLLTQNQRDPATPWRGAVSMRSALGDRARLVSVDQGGHGAYLHTENACVTNVATAFLVRGTFPATDVFCR